MGKNIRLGIVGKGCNYQKLIIEAINKQIKEQLNSKRDFSQDKEPAYKEGINDLCENQ